MKTDCDIDSEDTKVITNSLTPYQVIKKITWYEVKDEGHTESVQLNSLAFFDKNSNVLLKASGYDYDSGDKDYTERTVILNDNERVVGLQWKQYDGWKEMYDIQWLIASFI